MEKYYIIDINSLPDPRSNPEVVYNLPDERQKKCFGYLKPDDRKRSLAAGKIIQKILDNNLLLYKKNGKPYSDGIYFNISHSGKYVIGVSSDASIGCDIEEMTEAPIKVADRYFCLGEKDYINKHENPDFAFWQLWTLKESYMKMTGDGMSLSLKKFEVLIDNEIKVFRKGKNEMCFLSNTVFDNHMISICKDKEKLSPDKIEFIWI